MERLLIILVFISHGLFSQSHSSQIIKFVDKNMGKKVGDGVCQTLIDKAYRKFDRNWKSVYKKGQKGYYYGEVVDSADIQPGDVVVYDKIIRYDDVKLPSHIGIVYSVKNGNVLVAQQNCEGTLRESRVILMGVREGYRPEYVPSIKITYYRMP